MNERMEHLAQRLFNTQDISLTILYPEESSAEEMEAELNTKQDLIISGGSPHNVLEGHNWLEKKMKIIKSHYKKEGVKNRLLGVCFGHQAIHHAFGGTLEKRLEYISGSTSLHTHEGEHFIMNTSHEYFVSATGEGFEQLGQSGCEGQMIYATKHVDYPVVTLQQHPEKPLEDTTLCDENVIVFLRKHLGIEV